MGGSEGPAFASYGAAAFARAKLAKEAQLMRGGWMEYSPPVHYVHIVHRVHYVHHVHPSTSSTRTMMKEWLAV